MRNKKKRTMHIEERKRSIGNKRNRYVRNRRVIRIKRNRKTRSKINRNWCGTRGEHKDGT